MLRARDVRSDNGSDDAVCFENRGVCVYVGMFIEKGAEFLITEWVFAACSMIVGEQIHAAELWQTGGRCGNSGEVCVAVGDAWYQGHANDARDLHRGEELKTSQDRGIVNPGVSAVLRRIDDFQVEVNQVAAGSKQLEVGGGAIAGGIENNVRCMKLVDDFGDKRRLRQGFAAGKRDAALVVSQDIGLFVQQCGKFRGSVAASYDTRAGGTDNRLGGRVDAFRIVTPRTSQGAAFQEYGCAQSWPVVDGKLPDVEHNARIHGEDFTEPVVGADSLRW